MNNIEVKIKLICIYQYGQLTKLANGMVRPVLEIIRLQVICARGEEVTDIPKGMESLELIIESW